MGFGVWGNPESRGFTSTLANVGPPTDTRTCADSVEYNPPATWFQFEGLGFGVQGSGFGVWSLGFGALDLESRVWGLGFGVEGMVFRVQGLGFRV